MKPGEFNIAQINVASLKAPLDDPSQAEFVSLFDEINAVAEADADFVWRLTARDGGSSSYIQAFDDPLKVVNLTVWRTIEGLHRYVYRSRHREMLVRAREWLNPMTGPITALWWIEAGRVPDLADAVRRLDQLAVRGPTPTAFTFATRFPPEAEDRSR